MIDVNQCQYFSQTSLNVVNLPDNVRKYQSGILNTFLIKFSVFLNVNLNILWKLIWATKGYLQLLHSRVSHKALDHQGL